MRSQIAAQKRVSIVNARPDSLSKSCPPAERKPAFFGCLPSPICKAQLAILEGNDTHFSPHSAYEN